MKLSLRFAAVLASMMVSMMLFMIVSVMLFGMSGCRKDDDPNDENIEDGSVDMDAALALDADVNSWPDAKVDSNVNEEADSGFDADVDPDGDIQDETFWANSNIHYSGSGVDETANLDDCYYCDASDLGTHIMLRYQQGQGWTIWALYIPIDSSTGSQSLTSDYSGAYVTLSANDSSLPETAQGFYPSTSSSGTIHLTSCDPTSGGVIAGEIDATLEKDGVTAHLTATFSAQME